MDDEVPGELIALDGEVLAEVDAAALLACEPARGDLAHERVRRIEQSPQAAAAADQPGIAPQRVPGIGRVGDRGRIGSEARPVERGETRALPEDEALQQRVR